MLVLFLLVGLANSLNINICIILDIDHVILETNIAKKL